VSPLSQSSFFAEKVNQGIAKLMVKAREPVRTKVTNLLKSIVSETRGPDLPELQERVFEQIVVALCEHRRVRVYYRVKGKKHTYCTKIAPYRLTLSNGSWRLTARSSIHRRVIQFNLANIEKIETTGDHYSIPLYYLQSGHTGSKMPHVPPASAHLYATPSETK
jgi:predicted DNA-binding transcriptional regulator YafY